MLNIVTRRIVSALTVAVHRRRRVPSAPMPARAGYADGRQELRAMARHSGRRYTAAWLAGYIVGAGAELMSPRRRIIETAACAVLIVATVAGVTAAAVAEYGTDPATPGQLAPAAATVHGDHPRRDALRWLAAHLPACAFEDSRNCYWDARTSGNGRGESFVDIRGRAFYFRPAPLGGAS